ncbi:hypothetical protein D9M68_341790 [compost metagenome]
MSPAIQALVLQLLSTCLAITAKGKWHAHFSVAAHVRMVDIYILPSNTLYKESERRVRALSQAVYYDQEHSYSWETPEQIEQRALLNLAALLEDLQPFLADEVEEAAA